MADVPTTTDQPSEPVVANPGQSAFDESHSVVKPPSGQDLVVAAAAVPELTIASRDTPPDNGTWNNPRRFEDPAEMEKFFRQLAAQNQRPDGSSGPFTFVKPDVKPGQKGYAEYEGRVVTQADIDAGLKVVSSENPAGQRPSVGDLVMWKLNANGEREGQPWTPGGDKVNMQGEDKDGARYKFARMDGDRMIFSPKAVPTEMVPLNERVSLKLSWGTQEGGPGALLVRYGAGDLNVITNYDFVRLYEKGIDPGSQAMYDQVKAQVDGAFANLQAAGGEQVTDKSGRQVWNFPENTSLDNVSRTAADAAANLGIDLKVGINGIYATMKPGMTADEFKAEYAKAKAAVEAFRSSTEVGRESGRDVYKFGKDVELSRASQIAVQAAEALHQDIRVQVGNVELTVRPFMTESEFKAVHQTADAMRRASQEYFPVKDVPDAVVRDRLQSMYLRSNAVTIAEQYGVSHQRLLELMDPAQQDLIRNSQPDLKDKVAPLNTEERTMMDRALLDRFYQRGEEFRAGRTEGPPGFKPSGTPVRPETPELAGELAAAKQKAGTPEEVRAIEAIERDQSKWTPEERAKAARYLKVGLGMGISVAIIAGGMLALISKLRSEGAPPGSSPVVFGPPR